MPIRSASAAVSATIITFSRSRRPAVLLAPRSSTPMVPASAAPSRLAASFPSGNGLAGSTFDFAFDVLPGDGNQNGTVNSQDSAKAVALANAKTTGATSVNYSPFCRLSTLTGRSTRRTARSRSRTSITRRRTSPRRRRLPPCWRVGSGFTGLWHWACRRWRFDVAHHGQTQLDEHGQQRQFGRHRPRAVHHFGQHDQHDGSGTADR